MLGEFFYWVINMSIIASIMGLLVLILRKIKILPHRVSVFLWIVPFFRMCVPLGLNSPYSLMTLISHITTKTVTVYQPADDIAFSATNFIMVANSYFPITYKVNVLSKVFEIAAVIWIVIALAIIIALMVLYAATKRETKDAQLLYQNVFLSENVQSPAVYGIARPRIILPATYADKEIQYVLQHEKMHIRRADNLWRLLGFLAASVHWFNPLSWVFLKIFLSDIELACDETAVSNYSKEDRKEYAHSLLNCAENKNLFTSAFGGAKVRTRIVNILSYKRMAGVSVVSLAILVTAIIYVMLTNAS
jgi:beta-lactamase regulating signal transducer with metallopeptidase domain